MKKKAAGGVYPRACGGTVMTGDSVITGDGLSPRLRGNPFFPVFPPAPLGSIPAPAGEPCAPRIGTGSVRVYPRACGGTRRPLAGGGMAIGLSPRLRGNPHRIWWCPGPARSIPAPAGEPLRDRYEADVVKVYPRACGGTSSASLSSARA